MRETFLDLPMNPSGEPLPVTWVHTLVIGSGAAGLNAAVQLAQDGVNDLLVLTEGLDKGTSINTGSDKQTYYKLSLKIQCFSCSTSLSQLAILVMNQNIPGQFWPDIQALPSWA